MDIFHQLHDENMQTVQEIMTEQRERLIHNAEEVKTEIKKAFGCYFEWLREREAVLMRGVDKAVESHVSRWQSSVYEALIALKTVKESVELLDDQDGRDSGAPKGVKDQIEKMLRDMSSAMQSDLRMDHVVKFDESGKMALKTAVDNCGEVFTLNKDNVVPSIPTSKWSHWLHSSVNLEHLEEPELPYDFDDLGSMMSASKLARMASSRQAPVEKPQIPVVAVSQKQNEIQFNAAEEKPFDHFAHLMAMPYHKWLKTPQPQQAVAKTRIDRICPGETGNCVHVEDNLEIENLDQLRCVSPNVPKDLQTWLMQPDVVQLPAVSEICRSDRQCGSIGDCLSSDHCLNYFYNLTRRAEDWLSLPDTSVRDSPGFYQLEMDSGSEYSVKSSSGNEDFEVLSTPSSMASARRNMTVRRRLSVSEELKPWLKNLSAPSNCCEWLTSECCQESKRVFHPSSSKAIEEWLLKTN